MYVGLNEQLPFIVKLWISHHFCRGSFMMKLIPGLLNKMELKAFCFPHFKA